MCKALVTHFMDENSIEFHVASNDYLGTLGTTLYLLRRAIEDHGYQVLGADPLRRIRGGLLNLQANHTIQ